MHTQAHTNVCCPNPTHPPLTSSAPPPPTTCTTPTTTNRYATLQIPSNLLLKRLGGRLWLSIIIAAWGACAVAFAFMTSPATFYALRLALGVAEAGAFPGM